MFVKDYSEPVYSLTHTKASYWHRTCGCDGPPEGVDLLAWLFATHLEPLGFRVMRPELLGTARYVLLAGPGLERQRTDELYEALTGRASLSRWYQRDS